MTLTGRESELLERAVIALEKLNEDPILNIESGPPLCPHCNTMAPEVIITEDGGEGPFSEFYITPTCKNCNSEFFAVALDWAIFATYQEAEIELGHRREIFSNIPLNTEGGDE